MLLATYSDPAIEMEPKFNGEKNWQTKKTETALSLNMKTVQEKLKAVRLEN